ncbi:zf-DHHC-domain-containing protein [Mycena amicta]|nr:zf-DHHC-domain-containing protein [Mycena amicta]
MSSNASAPPDKLTLDKPSLCGTISSATYEARERRERRRQKPQPWVVLKLMLPITLGIIAYAGYVYAGRFVVRLVTGGRRGLGVGLLVPWSLLWLWTLWAYLKVILTPPGNACDTVPKTPRPLFPPTSWEGADDPLREEALADIEAGRIGGPSYEHQSSSQMHHDPQPPPSTAPTNGANSKRPPRGRMPPPSAPLLPPNRWCSKCAIVKPYRAHHCRVCGTCILKFDHHCPWIGQCVGARNHKFFVNFNLASALLATYTFVSVACGSTSPMEGISIHRRSSSCALAALFLLFTASLLFAHIRMILSAQTTVEGLDVRRLKERESAQLAADGWGFLAGWRKTPDPRILRRRVGRPDTEGNLWWPGSMRAAWEDVMGPRWLGWIFPIGRPLGNGLTYRPNPRFDADGRWRRRVEWPEALR